MELLYGTSNEGKLLLMRRMLKPLNLMLKGLKDMKETVPEPEETGKTLLENARIKARAYYETYQVPVFSCDTGLFFEGLPEELQPGIYVRRIQGRSCTDQELTDYFSSLARQFGGLKGRYRSAVCFYRSGQERYESQDSSLWGRPFLITRIPHPKTQEGFPIDRLSVQISSGNYYYDLPDYAQDELAASAEGVQAFFRRSLNLTGE